jgi:hypothetical protein
VRAAKVFIGARGGAVLASLRSAELMLASASTRFKTAALNLQSHLSFEGGALLTDQAQVARAQIRVSCSCCRKSATSRKLGLTLCFRLEFRVLLRVNGPQRTG